MEISHSSVIHPNKVLVATDGSEDATLAARVATDLSRRTGAELHVAHAWRDHVQVLGYPTLMWTDYSNIYERKAGRLLEVQVDSIEATGGVFVQPHLLHGPPIDAILDLCEELRPGLLVMGARGLGLVGRIFVGSVSEGVVHQARFPVLVVRGGEDSWPPERVISGDDGSGAAGLAAGLAGGLGGLFGAEDVLVRARRNPPEPIGGWSAEVRHRLEEMRSREVVDLKERAEAIRSAVGRRPGVRLVEGEATLALLQIAEEVAPHKTLLAVGCRGLGAVGRARLGSVSTNVLRAARGPVLIYSKHVPLMPDSVP